MVKVDVLGREVKDGSVVLVANKSTGSRSSYLNLGIAKGKSVYMIDDDRRYVGDKLKRVNFDSEKVVVINLAGANAKTIDEVAKIRYMMGM